eukprot:Rmarinus@m.19640
MDFRAFAQILLFFFFITCEPVLSSYVSTAVQCSGSVDVVDETGTIFSNDPSQTSSYLSGQTCSWTIRPNITTHFDLLLSFSAFDLEESPENVVFDFVSVDGIQHVGGELPALYTTEARSLVLVFSSDGSDQRTGFVANFSTIARTCPNDFTCSGDSTCVSGICVCPEGYFGRDCASNCPTNSTHVCYGHGTCSDSTFGTGVCTCDSGYEAPTCENESPAALDCPAVNGTACNGHGDCDSTTGQCTCETGWGDSDCSLEVEYSLCSGGYLLSEASGGSLWSNFDPPQAMYENNMLCVWLIKPAVDPSAVFDIRLKFSRFDVESGWDHVYVINAADASLLSNAASTLDFSAFGGASVVSLTGYSIPSDVVSSTGAMSVIFSSDYSVYYTGFMASYSVSLKSCPNDFTCENGDCRGQSCECDEGYFGKFCDSTCPGFSVGNICSGHGTCDEGSSGSGECECDEGYYGNNCQSECLPDASNPCSGHGSCDSDTGVCSCDSGYGGFDCSVVEPEYEVCEGIYELTASAGEFWSNYEDLQSTYDNYLACEWRIVPGGGASDVSSTITLSFQRFSVESYYDFVYVWDDLDKCNLVSVLDGHNIPADITSDTGVLVLRFVSDYSVVYPGFHASYAAQEPVCGVDFACVNDADCVDEACQCLPGYYGADCSQECPGGAVLPCTGYGTCDDGHNGTGTCNCTGSWAGPDCSLPCNCTHGTCDSATAICICSDGYAGDRCDQALTLRSYYGEEFYTEDSIAFKYGTRLQAVDYDNTIFLLGDAVIEREGEDISATDIGGNYIYSVCLAEDGCSVSDWTLRTTGGIWGNQMQHARIGYGAALVDDKLLLMGGYLVVEPEEELPTSAGATVAPSNCAPGCPLSWVGDDICDDSCYQSAACDYDDGDCDDVVSSSYCSPACPYSFLGDSSCDPGCYVADCYYDYGDCDAVSFCSTGCPETFIGDGVCSSFCNTASCSSDGGDCAGVLPDNYCAPSCAWSFVGDGVCDQACQVFECFNDLTDCDIALDVGEHEVVVSLAVDYWYYEASWNIIRVSDGQSYYAESQTFDSASQAVTRSVYLDDGVWQLSVWDSYGDGGITGSLSLGSDGSELASVPSYTSSAVVEFGLGSCAPGCDVLNVGDGVCQAACNTAECNNDGNDCSISVSLTVTTDGYPSESSWNIRLVDDSSSDCCYLFASDLTFSAAYEQHTHVLSLDPGTYELVLKDSYGDGGLTVLAMEDLTSRTLASSAATDYAYESRITFEVSWLVALRITTGPTGYAGSADMFAATFWHGDNVSPVQMFDGMTSASTAYTHYFSPATLGMTAEAFSGLSLSSLDSDGLQIASISVNIPSAASDNYTLFEYDMNGMYLDGRPFNDDSTYNYGVYTSEYHLFSDGTTCRVDGSNPSCAGAGFSLSLNVISGTSAYPRPTMVVVSRTGESDPIPLRHTVTDVGLDVYRYFDYETGLDSSAIVGIKLTAGSSLSFQVDAIALTTYDSAGAEVISFAVQDGAFALDIAPHDSSQSLRAETIHFGVGAEMLCVSSDSDSGETVCVDECASDPCAMGTCYDLPSGYACACTNGVGCDVDIGISLTVDSYPSEATWNIRHSAGSSYFFSSHQTFTTSGETTVLSFSLPAGIYVVDLFDSYGDGGITGTVTADGETVLSIATASYSTASHTFAIGSCSEGCRYEYIGDGRCHVDCLVAACFDSTDLGDCAIDLEFDVTVDSYPSEASWNVWDVDNAVYHFTSWWTFTSAGQSMTVTSALNPGDYIFYAYDSYGDGGLTGSVSEASSGFVIGTIPSYTQSGYIYFTLEYAVEVFITVPVLTYAESSGTHYVAFLGDNGIASDWLAMSGFTSQGTTYSFTFSPDTAGVTGESFRGVIILGGSSNGLAFSEVEVRVPYSGSVAHAEYTWTPEVFVDMPATAGDQGGGYLAGSEIHLAVNSTYCGVEGDGGMFACEEESISLSVSVTSGSTYPTFTLVTASGSSPAITLRNNIAVYYRHEYGIDEAEIIGVQFDAADGSEWLAASATLSLLDSSGTTTATYTLSSSDFVVQDIASASPVSSAASVVATSVYFGIDETLCVSSDSPSTGVDVCDNECASSPCHVDATCYDTPASYGCDCNAGYTGDGITTCDVSVSRRLLAHLEQRLESLAISEGYVGTHAAGTRHLSTCTSTSTGGAAGTTAEEDDGCGEFSSRYLNDVWKVLDLSASGEIDVEQIAACSGWDARYDFATFVRDGVVYLCGGATQTPVNSTDNLKNDCWMSEDKGITWVQLINRAEWEPRYRMMSAVHNNVLWVAGGEHIPRNSSRTLMSDIWWSSNGVAWNLVSRSSTANFGLRSGAAMISYNGYLFVLGGFVPNPDSEEASENPIVVANDVWRSFDGATWVEKASDAEFMARANGAVVVHDKMLVFIGGVVPAQEGQTATSTNFEDVWVSKFPEANVFPADAVVSTVKPHSASIKLAMINSGTYALTWTKSKVDKAWIKSVSPNGGVVPPAEYAELQVTVDPTNLQPGVHTGTITISTDDDNNPTVAVPIGFTVTANIDVNTTTVAGTGLQGSTAGLKGQVLIYTRDSDGFAVSSLLQQLYVTLRNPISKAAVSEPSVRFSSDGIFEAFYSVTAAGDYELEVLVEGDEVLGSPFTISIAPDVIDGSKSVVHQTVGSSVVAGSSVVFSLTARDAYENQRGGNNDLAGFTVFVSGAADTFLSADGGYITAPGNGTYRVTYVPTVAGTYTHIVKYNTDQLLNGLFGYTVVPASASAANSKIQNCNGDTCVECTPNTVCSSAVVAGEEYSLQIWALDEFGNVRKDADECSYRINGQAWTNASRIEGGVYRVLINETIAGVYFVEATVNDEVLSRGNSTEFVVVPADVSEQSVVEGCSRREVCREILPGTEQTFSIVTKDRFQNTRIGSGGTISFWYNSSNTFSGSDHDDGTYSFLLQLTVSGVYEVYAEVNGVEDVAVGTSPWYVFVAPGAPSPAESVAVFGGDLCVANLQCGPELVAGTNESIVIEVYDVYGNRRTSSSSSGVVVMVEAGTQLFAAEEADNGNFVSYTNGLLQVASEDGLSVRVRMSGVEIRNSGFVIVVDPDIGVATLSTVVAVDDDEEVSCVVGLLCSELSAGSTGEYLVYVRDLFGNVVAGDDELDYLSVVSTPGGIIDSVSLHEDEYIMFSLVNTVAGIYSLAVSHDGVALQNSPIMVSVYAGATSADHTYVLVDDAECSTGDACATGLHAGVAAGLSIITRDAYGNDRSSGSNGAFHVLISDGAETPISVSLAQGTGVYKGSISSARAGNHTVTVEYELSGVRKEVVGSGFYVNIVPAAASAEMSSASVDGATCVSGQGCIAGGLEAGASARLVVATSDEYGNVRSSSPQATLLVEVNGELFRSVDLGDGTYEAEIVLTAVLEDGYIVSVSLGSEAVGNSGFEIDVVPSTPDLGLTSVSSVEGSAKAACSVGATCGSNIVAGEDRAFIVQLRDRFGNEVTDGYGTDYVWWRVGNTSEPVSASFDSEEGEHGFSVVETLQGTYEVSVFLGPVVEDAAVIEACPFVVSVVPAATSPTTSYVLVGSKQCSFDEPCVVVDAGISVDCTIVTLDAFGNSRSFGSSGAFHVTIMDDGGRVVPVSHVSDSGQYQATLMSSIAGQHPISVEYELSGERNPIVGSDFLLDVYPADASASSSIAYLDGVQCVFAQNCVPSGLQAGSTSNLTVSTFDQFGNIRTTTAGVSLLVDVNDVVFRTHDANDGTYAASIMLSTVLDESYVVSVFLGSEPIGNSLFEIDVVPSPPSIHTTQIFSITGTEFAQCEAGATCVFSIIAGNDQAFVVQLRDDFMNDVLSEDYASSVFWAIGTEGMEPAAFDSQSGRHGFTTTQTLRGSYDVSVFLLEQLLASCPFSMDVVPGITVAAMSGISIVDAGGVESTSCAENVTCSGDVSAGSDVSIEVITRDAFGNKRDSVSSGFFRVSVLDVADGTSFSISNVAGTGSYVGGISSEVAGVHAVIIQYELNGEAEAIDGSGFLLAVVPAAAAAAMSVASLNGVVCSPSQSCVNGGLEAGAPAELAVATFDTFGNIRDASAGVTLMVEVNEVLFKTVDNSDGTYSCTLVLETVIDDAYVVSAILGTDELGNSGFEIDVIPAAPSAATSYSYRTSDSQSFMCEQNTICGGTAMAGVELTMKVQLVDMFGNDVISGYADAVWWSETNSTDVSSAAFSEASGVHSFVFSRTVSGTYSVEVGVMFEDAMVVFSSSPTLLSVVPNVASPSNSSLAICADGSCTLCVESEPCLTGLAAGSDAQLTIYTRDVYDNDRVSPSTGSYTVVFNGEVSLATPISGTGQYSGTLSSELAGLHTVMVYYQSASLVYELPGSGFLVGVDPAAASAQHSSAFFNETLPCQPGYECLQEGLEAGVMVQLAVQTFDQYSNARTSGSGSPLVVRTKDTWFPTDDYDDGMYSANITLTVANVYTVDVFLGSNKVTPSSGFSLQVFASQPDAKFSYVRADDVGSGTVCQEGRSCSSIVAGGADGVFYVFVLDSFGNTIDDHSADVAVRTVEEELSDNLNFIDGGAYQFLLSYTEKGDMTVEVDIEGNLMPSTPFLVSISAGTTNPGLSSVDGCEAEVVCANTAAGTPTVYTIVPRDHFGNEKDSESEDSFSVTSALVGSSSYTSVAVAYNGDGTYSFEVLLTQAGSYSIFVDYAGEEILGSGFHVSVVPGPVDAESTYVVSLDPSADEATTEACRPDRTCGVDVAANELTEYYVLSHDQYGNALNDSSLMILYSYAGQMSKAAHSSGNEYKMSVLSTLAGTYDVDVRIADTEVQNSGFYTVIVAGEPSPLQTFVSVGGDLEQVCSSNQPCGTSLAAGLVSEAYWIHVVDEYGNAVTEDVSVAYYIDGTPHIPSLLGGEPGVYSFVLTSNVTETKGAITVNVTLNGIEVKTSPFLVVVVPGSVSALNTYVVECGNEDLCVPCAPGVTCVANVAAGTSLDFFLRTVDALGNDRDTQATGIFTVLVDDVELFYPSVAVGYQTNGIYRMLLTYTVSGSVSVVVNYDGAALGNTPFVIEVIPADPSAAHSVVSSGGTGCTKNELCPANTQYEAGAIVSYSVLVTDQFGNICDDGAAYITLTISVGLTTTFTRGNYTGNGVYGLEFSIERASDEWYSVDVAVDGTSVGNSFFKLSILPGVADADHSYVSLEEGQLSTRCYKGTTCGSVVAGEDILFSYYVNDRFDNQIRSGESHSTLLLKDGGYSANATFSSSTNLYYVTLPGSYSETSGQVELTPMIGDAAISSSSPLLISVVPGSVSAGDSVVNECGFSGVCKVLTASDVVEEQFSVTPRDMYGNDIEPEASFVFVVNKTDVDGFSHVVSLFTSAADSDDKNAHITFDLSWTIRGEYPVSVWYNNQPLGNSPILVSVVAAVASPQLSYVHLLNGTRCVTNEICAYMKVNVESSLFLSTVDQYGNLIDELSDSDFCTYEMMTFQMCQLDGSVYELPILTTVAGTHSVVASLTAESTPVSNSGFLVAVKAVATSVVPGELDLNVDVDDEEFDLDAFVENLKIAIAEDIGVDPSQVRIDPDVIEELLNELEAGESTTDGSNDDSEASSASTETGENSETSLDSTSLSETGSTEDSNSTNNTSSDSESSVATSGASGNATSTGATDSGEGLATADTFAAATPVQTVSGQRRLHYNLRNLKVKFEIVADSDDDAVLEATQQNIARLNTTKLAEQTGAQVLGVEAQEPVKSEPDPSQSYVQVALTDSSLEVCESYRCPSDDVLAGETREIQAVAVDEYGNQWAGSPGVPCYFVIDGAENVGTDNGDGTYSFGFRQTVVGEYNVAVLIYLESVSSTVSIQSFEVVVTPSAFSAQNSTLIIPDDGRGVLVSVTGDEDSSFLIEARDRFNNIYISDADDILFTVTFRRLDSTVPLTFYSTKHKDPGTYEVVYSISEFDGGDYELSVFFQVGATQQHVVGSPFEHYAQCRSGLYHSSDETECLECPEGGVCSREGLRIQNIGTQENYWRPGPDEAVFYLCLNDDIEINYNWRNESVTTPVCRGLEDGWDYSVGSDAQCATGHMGRLCGECVFLYSRDVEYVCNPCPEEGDNYGLMTLAVLIILAVYVFLVWKAIRGQSSDNKRHALIFKSLLSYLQVVSFATQIDVDWPKVLMQFFKQETRVSSPDPSLLSLDCMIQQSQGEDVYVFPERLSLLMWGPALIVGVVIFVFFLVFVRRVKTRHRVRRMSWTQVQQFAKVDDDIKNGSIGNACVAIIVLSFLIYPTITKEIFKMFNCHRLGDDGGMYMLEDLSVECFGPLHVEWMVKYSIPGLCVYVFGIPAVGFMALYKNRKQLDDPEVKRRYGFLFTGYERPYYWWEIWVTIRKTLVVFIVVIMQPMGVTIQGLSLLGLLMASIVIHSRFLPYEEDQLDGLEYLGLVVAFFTIYMGLFFEQEEIYEREGLLLGLAIVVFMANVCAILAFLMNALKSFKDDQAENLDKAKEMLSRVSAMDRFSREERPSGERRSGSMVDRFGRASAEDGERVSFGERMRQAFRQSTASPVRVVPNNDLPTLSEAVDPTDDEGTPVLPVETHAAAGVRAEASVGDGRRQSGDWLVESVPNSARLGEGEGEVGAASDRNLGEVGAASDRNLGEV